MKTKDEYYIACDEWEPLQDNLIVKNISEIGELHPATERILISRSNKYELDVHVEGTKARLVENPNQLQRVAGKSIPGSQVIGATATGEVVTLENAVQGDYSVRGDGRLEGEAFVGIIHVDYRREEQIARKTIWCLNGPSSFSPPRATEWERTEEYKKEQKTLNQNESELTITKKGRSSSTAFNHWLIKCNQFEFRFCFVPKDLGPAWSQNCRLDFNLPQPTLDSEEGQEAVLEALSFITGKRLIRVATTDYAIDGYPLEESLYRAWGLDIFQECSNPSQEPIRLDKGHKHFLLEKEGPTIIDTYIKHRNELALSDTMWLMWLANLVPVGSSLVYLSAAMENLMTAWFKSTKSKLGGMYMPKTEWDAIVKDPLVMLQTNLKGNKYSDRIINKVNNANNFGPNERFEYFFDEVSLAIGDVEKSAVKARNRFAHGIEKDPKKIEGIISSDRALRTLLHRCLLKVLGYKGEYIDYSTLGHPTRPIDEPIGGIDGKGQPIKI